MKLKSADVLKIARRVDKEACYHTGTEQRIDSERFIIIREPLEYGWNKSDPPAYHVLEKVPRWGEMTIKGYDIKDALSKAKKVPGLRKAIGKHLNFFRRYDAEGNEFKKMVIGEHSHTFEPEIRSMYDESTGELLWKAVCHDLNLEVCKYDEDEIYRHLLGVVTVTDNIVKTIRAAHAIIVDEHETVLKDELERLVKNHKEPKQSPQTRR
jgi:hypothetical protein